MPAQTKSPHTGFQHTLKIEMEKRGWTQLELAEKVGTTRNTIARLSRGEQEPSWSMVVMICDAMSVRPNVFWLPLDARITASQVGHAAGPE